MFGESHPEGRPQDSDEAILRWIGSEQYRDLVLRDMDQLKGEPAPKLRSNRQIIELALKQFKIQESSAERIRRKFRGEVKRKWLDVAISHDDVP